MKVKEVNEILQAIQCLHDHGFSEKVQGYLEKEINNYTREEIVVILKGHINQLEAIKRTFQLMYMSNIYDKENFRSMSNRINDLISILDGQIIALEGTDNECF